MYNSVIQTTKEDKMDEFVEVKFKSNEGEEIIKFANYKSFHKTLTPQRMQILKYLIKNNKVSSINALAKALGRAFKNVREDLTVLEMIGLVKIKDEENRKVPIPVTDSLEIFIDIENLPVETFHKKLTLERLASISELLREKLKKRGVL